MTKHPFKPSPRILACLAATWFIWGSTYLAIKFALISLPPYLQMGSRFVVAGLALMLWMKFRGATMPSAIQWRNALIVGALMLGGGMGGVANAEQTIASGLVVTFIAVQPMLQAALLSLWKIYPTRLECLGIVIGLVGVVMLVNGQGFSSSVAGLIAITSAISAWAVGSVLSQKLTPLAPGATGFGSEMLMGGLVLLGLSGINGEHVTFPLAAESVIAWAYLVIFGSLIAFNAYMVLLDQAPPALATSYSFVNPIIALILGVSFGQEMISQWEWFSATIIVAGVILIVYASIRKHAINLDR
jgi:drug/metabolite transporter (DMT)-like permease